MPDQESVGSGVCVPEVVLSIRPSDFALKCDAWNDLASRVMAAVHQLNRRSARRIAVAFPEMSAETYIGEAISACGDAEMMSDLRRVLTTEIPSGALVLQETTPENCSSAAWVRSRVAERHSPAAKARDARRRARRRKPERPEDTRKPGRVGAHLNVVMHGRVLFITPRRADAEPVDEILVSTWGLSSTESPCPIPFHA